MRPKNVRSIYGPQSYKPKDLRKCRACSAPSLAKNLIGKICLECRLYDLMKNSGEISESELKRMDLQQKVRRAKNKGPYQKKLTKAPQDE